MRKHGLYFSFIQFNCLLKWKKSIWGHGASNKGEGLPWIIIICRSEVNQQGNVQNRRRLGVWVWTWKAAAQLDRAKKTSVCAFKSKRCSTNVTCWTKQSQMDAISCVIIALKQVLSFLMHGWTGSFDWETEHLHFNVYFTENDNPDLNKNRVNINCSGKELLQKIIQTHANPCSTGPSTHTPINIQCLWVCCEA